MLRLSTLMEGFWLHSKTFEQWFLDGFVFAFLAEPCGQRGVCIQAAMTLEDAGRPKILIGFWPFFSNGGRNREANS